MSNIRRRASRWVTCLTVLLGSVIAYSLAAEPVGSLTSSAPTRITRSQITATVLNAPMSFEANHGQTDPSVNFIARGSGYTLFLTPSESVMVLQQRDARGSSDNHDSVSLEPAPIKQSIVRMKLEGANPEPTIEGQEKLPGIVNYFIGNDPAKWRTKIPTYAKVHYKEAYPGIDLAYYGNQGKLEYDFIVAPGADPNQIKLAFEGASEIKIAESGDLLLATALGEVRVQKPIVYQLEKDGHKTLVAGDYISSRAANHIGIRLAGYDRSKPLVIDPVLSFSSFLGGAGGDEATDIGIDPAGNVWVVGNTAGLTLAPAGIPYDSSFNGAPSDIFVLKVSPSGTPLVWTYIGGPFNDHTPAITFDSTGNAWLTGTTGGGSFPVTPGNLQAVYQGGGDAFIVKLDPNGSTLLYATFYGTPLAENGRSIAVDGGGVTVYLGGETTSATLPGSGGSVVQPNFAGVQDGFIAKINIPSAHIEYVTYLGGTARESLSKIKLDASGNLHVVGQTFSTDFPGTALSSIPSLASVQPNFGGGTSDAFAVKLNATGTQLLYSTFLGGNDAEAGLSVALDSMGNAVVSGNTRSSNFPLAGTPFQSTRVGNDYFAAKINQNGSAPLIFSTYFGGIGNDSGGVVALDQFDNIYLSGQSNSCTVPPFSHPLQINVCPSGVGVPIFVGQLDSTGSSLLSLFGFTGNGSSISNGLVTDGHGSLYIAGFTRAPDFMTLNAIQGTFGGGTSDAFFAKLTYKPIANAGPDQSVSMGTLVTLDGTNSTGGSLTYAWTKVAGPTVALGEANTAHPTFVAPNVPAAGATVTFQLIVCEGTSNNCSDPATVNVHIRNVNHPPVAQAGPDQMVQEGSPVILDGTASYDPDIETLTFTWLQVFGTPVTLAYPNTATPSFTAPQVGATGGQVDFELIVTDPRGLSHSDFVSIVISNVNQPPVAHAGADQTKNENTLVTLDGSGSHDPDLDGLSYHWSQIGGPGVALTGATTASPTFTAPNVAAGGAFLTFQLVVHDGHVSSVADTVRIAVVNVNDPPVCTLAQASPNLLWPPNHTMTQVSVVGLTDPQNQTLTITYPRVKQDEPINGLGDGDTSPDAAVSGNDILLRAERSGNGNGRVYVVQFTATNSDGAQCSGTVKVAVPHNKKDQAVEGTQLYNSFGP